MKDFLALAAGLVLFAGSSPAAAQSADDGSLEQVDAGTPGADGSGQGTLLASVGVTAGAPDNYPSGAVPAAAGSGFSGGFFRAPSFGNAPAPVPGLSTPAKAAAGPRVGASVTGGRALQIVVLQHAHAVGDRINATGGYRFDGVNDCYGFVRRTWNPILESRKLPDLPVDDYPSRNWAPITDWRALMPGDVLATAQGHHWGGNWHGGLFAGMRGAPPLVFDDTPGPGASIHPDEVFHFYYVPTHLLLSAP